jgi:hypothetical protein
MGSHIDTFETKVNWHDVVAWKECHDLQETKEASENEIIIFCKTIVGKRKKRCTYITLKRLILEHFTVHSFKKHKTAVQNMLKQFHGLVGAEDSCCALPSSQRHHNDVDLDVDLCGCKNGLVVKDAEEFNEVLIQERNNAMRKINQDLYYVREIMSDLATLINDQQDESVEAIAANVKKSATYAKLGKRELERANDDDVHVADNNYEAQCVVS